MYTIKQVTDTFNKLSLVQKVLVSIILVVVLYSISTALSYKVFIASSGGSASVSNSPLPGPASVVEEDANDPKTEACPLNGSLKSAKAKAAWDLRRPLAVMIENHEDARPQSGLTSADVVYEAVAEGGITRFMALFYCNLSEVQVGPVRSARTYFIDWLSEYNALYAHVGGANTAGPADALGQIIKYDIKDLNQFSIGFPTFWRDYQRLGHPVATEHTMYSTTQKLWEVGAKRGWVNTDEKGIAWNKNFVSWKFKDNPLSSGNSATDIKVDFWQNQGAYSVEWTYDAANKVYKRKNGGSEHIDLNNKKQIQPMTVVVQFETESPANDGYEGNAHRLYGTLGKGKALVFMDGKVVEGNWNKKTRLDRSTFTDASGKEIEFNKGQIWIQTVPEGSKVTY